MATVAPITPAEEEASPTFDEPLLKMESGLIGMMGEGITTVTFFKGEMQTAAAFLKGRLAAVAEANPWIWGVLVKEKQHGKLAHLRFAKGVAPAATEHAFRVDDSWTLSEEMEYSAMVKAINKSGAKLPQGRKLINTPQCVSKLTVVPTTGGGGFAVIFSMSHTVSNGGTYYQIFNMLTATPIVAMKTERSDQLREAVDIYMGKSQLAYLNGATNAFNALGKIGFGKTPTAHCFLVDDAKLKLMKEEEKAKPGAPTRLSANDILTSGYGRACKSRLLESAHA